MTDVDRETVEGIEKLASERRAQPPALAPVRENQGDREPRKAHYGVEGEQPWDAMLRLGWGPVAAASNILRYLRRSKMPEHSLESARWYYARLYEGAARENTSRDPESPWSEALGKLENELTRDELRTLRGSDQSV